MRHNLFSLFIPISLFVMCWKHHWRFDPMEFVNKHIEYGLNGVESHKLVTPKAKRQSSRSYESLDWLHKICHLATVNATYVSIICVNSVLLFLDKTNCRATKNRMLLKCFYVWMKIKPVSVVFCCRVEFCP